jgi:transcriptional regulator with XRE-family HTH domain
MMTKLHQNIRDLREARGWNLGTMATLLGMSEKAYGRLELGKTDVQLSRLQQIAQLLEVEVGALFMLDKVTIMKLSIHHSQTKTTNTGSPSINIIGTTSALEHELEKARLVMEQKDLVLEQKDKEIFYLKGLLDRLVSRLGGSGKEGND